MKVYTAGKMTGLPQFNFPTFDAAAADLRAQGYDVVSPAELDDPADRAAALASPDGSMLTYGKGSKKTWGDFLSRDVKLITDGGIEAVFVLPPDWKDSRGARLETYVARGMNGLPVYRYWKSHRLTEVSLDELVEAWIAGLPQFVGGRR